MQRLRHFTGRKPAGSHYEEVISKNGIRHTRHDLANGKTREILCVGGACSEVFTGPRLARVLQPAIELQRKSYEALSQGISAPSLSQHTSAGVPVQALDEFLEALSPHLPWHQQPPEVSNDDWFVSLQTEGASAVWAATDLLLQLQHLSSSPDTANLSPLSDASRPLVAVGARSYHGPPSSSFGSGTPLGPKPGQVSYPVPQRLERLAGESVEAWEGRAVEAIDQWFSSKEAARVGVMLVEPQWGSSMAAQPWPPKVLRHLCEQAKDRGILICADEIMCGLGRHGKGTLFLSGLRECEEESIAHLVDAVTFGKAIAGGCGHLLSGVAVKQGASALNTAGKSALQIHTYAGASPQALLTASQVLRELPHVAGLRDPFNSRTSSSSATSTSSSSSPSLVARGGAVVGQFMEQLERESGGAVLVQGQGLMWGALFNCPAREDEEEGREVSAERSAVGSLPSSSSSSSLEARREAARRFAKHCDDRDVVAYTVHDTGGFMLTPPLDAADDSGVHHGGSGCAGGSGGGGGSADLEEAMARVVGAALATVRDLRAS